MPAPDLAMIPACGGEITFCGRGDVQDSGGHPVFMAHSHAVDDLLARNSTMALRLSEVVHLHAIDPDGLIPLCAECHKPHPCPTVAAATRET